MSPSLAKRHARAAQPREDAEWWVIEVQVEELRGCTMKGGYTVVARHHLVSVGVRIAVNEEVVKIPEVKTYPFPKNPRAKGADWTVAHPEVPKGETTPILLRVFASRDDAVSLKFTAREEPRPSLPDEESVRSSSSLVVLLLVLKVCCAALPSLARCVGVLVFRLCAVTRS